MARILIKMIMFVVILILVKDIHNHDKKGYCFISIIGILLPIVIFNLILLLKQ